MSGSAAFSGRHYTLERDGRELQLIAEEGGKVVDYTLERDGRELQPNVISLFLLNDYTLERDGRELQHALKAVTKKRELYP